MINVIHTGLALPWSFNVDPDCQFEAGMVAELGTYGNNVVCGVSGGKNPIGLIDDYRTTTYSRAVVDEVVIAQVTNTGYDGLGRLVTTTDIICELEHPFILPSSFISDPVSVELNEKNGTIRFLAGTPLNCVQTNDGGEPDSIRTVVRYSYQIPNISGEDTTAGSGQVTVWITPGIIFQTDIYDTSQQYPLNALLYCGLDGKLTTSQIDPTYPACAILTGPPNSVASMIEAKWLI